MIVSCAGENASCGVALTVGAPGGGALGGVVDDIIPPAPPHAAAPALASEASSRVTLRSARETQSWNRNMADSRVEYPYNSDERFGDAPGAFSLMSVAHIPEFCRSRGGDYQDSALRHLIPAQISMAGSRPESLAHSRVFGVGLGDNPRVSIATVRTRCNM
jgi:hypothetical protein